MDIDVEATDRLLTTTRAVRRRLDLDRPVERDILLQCVAIAQQAPSGSNRQGWSFVIITDPNVRARVAQIYRDTVGHRFAALHASAIERGDLSSARVYASAQHLTDVLDRVPVHVVPCIQGRLGDDGRATAPAAALFGSILPATWSFQLALRSRGLGSAWTTVHLAREQEMAELLGIPADVTQAALLPVAYYTGKTFAPAPRPEPESITHWDHWTS